MRKLLFFDIDGTILSEGEKRYVPDSAIRAIRELQQMAISALSTPAEPGLKFIITSAILALTALSAAAAPSSAITVKHCWQTRFQCLWQMQSTRISTNTVWNGC